MTKKIALIDDELIYQDMIADWLRAMGYTCEMFSSTNDFLLQLKSGADYGLIIVDRFGPDFDVVKDRFCESCFDFGYKNHIILYSHSERPGATLAFPFAAVIGKDKVLTKPIIQKWYRP